jgi:hypothetical protein
MYYLQRISRPADIAVFLTMAEKSCGYILPHRYIENSEVYALMCRKKIVGGFVYSQKDRLLTHVNRYDVEITHIWLKDNSQSDEQIEHLRRGIATVIKDHGDCRCELIFRDKVLEELSNVFHYGTDDVPRPIPKTRSWQGFTTRFVNGNPSNIPFEETFNIKHQNSMNDVSETLVAILFTVSIALGVSGAPDKAIGSLFNFLASAPAKIIADLSHISWATAIFLLLVAVSPALIAGLLVYKRLTGVLEGVVPLVQEKQAASANLIENGSSIPTYRPMVIVKEDTDLRVV